MGLLPASNDNETEYDKAVRNIWPILFTWSQASGMLNVTESTLSCLHLNKITSGSRDPNASNKGSNGDNRDSGDGDKPGTAGTYSVPTLGATLLLAVFASWIIFL